MAAEAQIRDPAPLPTVLVAWQSTGGKVGATEKR